MGAERDGGGCQEIGRGRAALRVGMIELNDVLCWLSCADVFGILDSGVVCTVVCLKPVVDEWCRLNTLTCTTALKGRHQPCHISWPWCRRQTNPFEMRRSLLPRTRRTETGVHATSTTKRGPHLANRIHAPSIDPKMTDGPPVIRPIINTVGGKCHNFTSADSLPLFLLSATSPPDPASGVPPSPMRSLPYVIEQAVGPSIRRAGTPDLGRLSRLNVKPTPLMSSPPAVESRHHARLVRVPSSEYIRFKLRHR